MPLQPADSDAFDAWFLTVRDTLTLVSSEPPSPADVAEEMLKLVLAFPQEERFNDSYVSMMMERKANRALSATQHHERIKQLLEGSEWKADEIAETSTTIEEGKVLRSSAKTVHARASSTQSSARLNRTQHWKDQLTNPRRRTWADIVAGRNRPKDGICP
ncbi:hypothetical protein DAEQUDRAFT_766789 [Daedalea quercina L-15889]|uniref:Uncharacterized protein n=1 Tax=Daedalea quercina L-15889 TaxID=1314783 RepID=A0A165P6H2_9APHY|nr:hypothetical protein DAEQUDRAFT_766789 [Daedalea quercina L-15889]